MDRLFARKEHSRCEMETIGHEFVKKASTNVRALRIPICGFLWDESVPKDLYLASTMLFLENVSKAVLLRVYSSLSPKTSANLGSTSNLPV